ncbi:hypothetical protein VKT23_009494 [Stygiomarasmius scandens]|uniref:Uncharacterized protein n=1 Tax=Marasmiellus scandens TaxID=2682957 RepID=A0ABR1JEW3_9AGAR
MLGQKLKPVHSGPPPQPPHPLPPCPRQPYCSHCNRVSHDTSPPLIPIYSSAGTSVDKACPRLLINVHTLKLVHFKEDHLVPHYAILTRLWGFKKDRSELMRFACNQAHVDGLDYLLDDTWFINSYEVNNVHRNISYYRNASVCYVIFGSWEYVWRSQAWTLQELLAPPELFFFANESFVGSRTERSKEISDQTGISEDVISGRISVYDVSVQERMTWAMKKATINPLDCIYGLVGILGVSMRMGYKEGYGTAFARLREAFHQQHPDQVDSFEDGWRNIFDRRLHVGCSCHPSEIPYVSPSQNRPFLCGGNITLRSDEVIVLTTYPY